MILRAASALFFIAWWPAAAMAEGTLERRLADRQPAIQQSELPEADSTTAIEATRSSRLKFRDRAVCLCADGLSEKDIRNNSRIPDNRKEPQQQDQVSDEKY